MQLDRSPKIQELQKKLRNVLKKFKSLNDIIIFGSSVKGKIRPNDVDVALILSNESELPEIKVEVRKISNNIHIEVIESSNSIYNIIWVVLIREGFSVKKDKYLHELYKLKPMVLYKYNLTKLNPVQKVQFSRGIKNFVTSCSGEFLSRSVVLIPLSYKYEMDALLERWNILYDSRDYELFPILINENLI